MFRNSVYRLLNLTAATLLVAGLTAAQALTPAGPKRPGAVPVDYVITPFGYFHPSCVTHLAKGDVVRQDENGVQHADGSFEESHVCAFPHFDPKGIKVAAGVQGAKDPTISHAWLEYASTTATPGSSFGALLGEWTVPPAPSANDGQTVYLFPGMEDDDDVVTIIQPVLGWNADFGSAWGIASWNCCAAGTVYESSPVRVNSGDTIFGEVVDDCAAGTLSCPTWDIITEDLTLGTYTELDNTSSQGQTFNWAFAGALEVYNIAQCADFPSNGAISFNNLSLYTKSFKVNADPAWSVTSSSNGQTPQCNYGGAIVKSVNLTY